MLSGVYFMKTKPVLGFANQKGGVGKTTWSKIFSEYMAIIQDKETLGIDIDSQTSFTARYFGINKNPVTDFKEPPLHPYYDPNNTDGWDGRSSIADIFFGKLPKPYPTQIKKLDIILNEARTKERTRRLKIFENRKKVLDLIDETAKTNDNKMP